MSIPIFTNSGKAAVIELEKEIEISKTKAALVTVELVFEAKAKSTVQILVNKELVAEVNPGELTEPGDNTVSFEVAAGQKYEVKKATLLKEAKASIALEQQNLSTSDVEGLLAEGTAAAEVASVAANATVASTNAKILNIGKLNYQGAYSEEAVYVKGAIVTFEGGSYELLAAEAEEEPPTRGKTTATWLFRT